MNKLNQEYYVMSMDGANNHPLLDWGNIDFSFVLESNPIEKSTLDLPLKIVFGEPYPIEFEMADLLMLSTNLAASETLKEIFEENKIYGVQFIPLEIKSNKGVVITGHYVMHVWNKLPAIDKKDYEGGKPNKFGNILDLHKFSLDENLLKDIPFEKRLIFELAENSTITVIHKSLFEKLNAKNLTGILFFRVDDWDANILFR